MIDNAVTLYPDDLGIRIRHAEAAMAVKAWRKAISRWTHIIENFSEFPDGVYWRLARAYLNNFEFDPAKALVKRLENTLGAEQRVLDLISLVESEEAKKYALSVKRIAGEAEYFVDSFKRQARVARIDFFKSYRLKGWVKKTKLSSCQLIFESSTGTTSCFDLNSTRNDVVSHFRRQGQEVEPDCGFDYSFDLRHGGKLGFLIDGVELWVAYFEVTAVRSVLGGKDGWLFLDNDTNGSVDQFIGTKCLSSNNAASWAKYAEELVAFQRKLNIVLLIANSKENVVPHLYPFKRAASTISDEVERILSVKRVNYINPVEIMSSEEGTYYKTDTHWSDFGGYLAYLSCMKRLGYEDKLNGISFDEVEVVGDLGSKLVPIKKAPKKVHSYSGARADLAFRNGLSGTGAVEIWTNDKAIYKQSVLMFGGSSLRSGRLYKYFSYSFLRVVIVNLPGSMVEEILEYESPDLVVVQNNERYLGEPGRIYKRYSNSPLAYKISSLPAAEKESVLTNLEAYTNERFYYTKCLEALEKST